MPTNHERKIAQLERKLQVIDECSRSLIDELATGGLPLKELIRVEYERLLLVQDLRIAIRELKER